MADSTGNSIVRGISATMNGSKQNIHEMNSDVNGLILPILIRTNGGMILLNITEEDSIIGKKHTDSISDTIKQNNDSYEGVLTPDPHSFYAFGLAAARHVPA